jgi:tetratricopeptide (TPR) repeat protein
VTKSVLLACWLAWAAGSAAAQGAQAQTGDVPLFEGMGPHQRKVSTSSPQAQRYFDQGLTWAYAFNHDEAIRSFRKAAEIDPDCAMAWWGVALCNGPHINNPVMAPERSKAAWEALQKAVALKDKTTPTERALIEALTARYADPAPEDRSGLDKAYAEAMRKVWQANQKDPDVGTLFAESIMDLRPWDLWTKAGEPHPGTEEAIAVLEAVMAMQPDNPGANHLYIHVIEASPNPARANAAADRLRKLVPASGHLVHMPSHIDVLTGRWDKASQQNERSIEIDRDYRAKSPKQGFYRLYMAHNHHMLSFAAMMEGRAEAGLKAARDIVDSVPEEHLRENVAMMDPFMGAAYDVLKRFGRWDEILSEPAPPDFLPITTAMWHYARGLARSAKSEIEAARREQIAFRDSVAKVPADAMFSINPAREILRIADHMLEAEIVFRDGKIDATVAELRKGIVIEDALRYMEPPEWIQPVRHTLGAILLSAGRFVEAEKVYREDLAKWPEIGWSLYGLSRSLEGQGKESEAKAVRERFEKVWKRADTPIQSSCLCVPKT